MPKFAFTHLMPLAVVALVPAAPALAQVDPAMSEAPLYTPPPVHPHAAPAASGIAWAPGQQEAYERARTAWLGECRRRMAMAYEREDRGIGGGLIGAVFGGLLGNRIAGRNDRTFGTIAGAAVGAVAGAAIDRAEGREQPAQSDYCESYLDYHSYAGTYQAQAHPVMMVHAAPMMHHAAPAAAPQQDCKEEVVYEDVEVPVAQPARRMIPRRPAPAKRVPDKRIPL
jgi:uncharacterized protein YcfJ